MYCTRSLGKLTAKQLLKGITDQDPKASAGVDYLTLAEGYDVDEDEAEAGEAALAVEDNDDGFLVTYGDATRPIFVRRWNTPKRVAEELSEIEDDSPKVTKHLAKTIEVIGIELGASQLTTFGVVVAYEVARYLAQKGNGFIRDLEDEWTRIEDGGFADVED